MDILFLDIDGVLNNTSSAGNRDGSRFIEKDLAICRDNLENLKRLLEKFPDLKIVWSTDWRYRDEQTWFGWRNPIIWLKNQPWMAGRIIGKTPCKMSSEHYHEIKWWLDDHPETENYVIFEDSCFPKDWFGIDRHTVYCDEKIGLTAEAVATAEDILKGKLP